jgi:hypothetical protein
MPVFDKSTKVGRKVKDPGTDKTLPVEKALSYSAMTSTGGLAGATGIDCKLVHGERFQVIDANMTESVGADEKTTITGSETHTVMVNETYTVQGNRSHMVMGTHMLNVFNSSTYLYLGAVSKLHMLTKTETMLAGRTSTDATWAYSNKVFDGENIALQQQNIGATESNIGAQMQFIGFLAQFVLSLNLGVNTLNVTANLAKAKSEALSARMQGALTKLVGGEVGAEGGTAEANATVNALPHVCACTPA